ncbi:hypothetical protein A2U01_0065571, partial [Trifolium medium]|nr:hypothetical protein [Trifolium medium]
MKSLDDAVAVVHLVG